MTSTPETTANFEFSALSAAKNYRRALVQELSPQLKGRVIEIGAGIGQMTREFMALPDISLQSVEPDPAFCAEFRKSLSQQPLIQGTIQDVSGDWDAIVSVNVLEHIEKDQEELVMYYNLLKNKQGTVNIFVPARPELYAPIDKDFGHFRRYTKKTLSDKLIKAGFTIEKMRYYNFTGYFAWWLKFCLLKARSFKSRDVVLYDRAIFPVVHFMETKICPPPWGQSLLVVARAKK
ncbi:MAG: methyltransferase domain-containing protein [Patescibacteria group bacterium]